MLLSYHVSVSFPVSPHVLLSGAYHQEKGIAPDTNLHKGGHQKTKTITPRNMLTQDIKLSRHKRFTFIPCFYDPVFFRS